MSDFTILALPSAYAAGVAGTLDLLRAATLLAPRMALPRPRWRVVSPAGGIVPLSNGILVETRRLPRRSSDDRSTWVVPGLGLASAEAIAAALTTSSAQRAARALAALVAGGGSVAASCSAVFLLQAAGILPGRRVTTSWWLAPHLRRLEPRCVVDADRMVCADGPISTAGAAFAQIDLMLHLLRERFGAAMADAVGRVLLVDGREAQSRFVVPALLSSGNELVVRLLNRIEAALPQPPSVATLAAEFAVSQRTLARRVRETTGRSTKDLVQSVRLNRARRLIESSRLSIEEVAARVGYEDATALRRLMRKMAGSRPSQYRSTGAWS